ncbi:hypothetical protein [Edaphobacter aggregans]|uniref:hypothetical protein n=1 Tax=Edaphobacter aggregans TaxID=570835 RepID=UPI001FE1DBB7|nr:hypothetical protein [Edaphobacter aggregans]
MTDGARSTRDANHRWPDVLASRLQADKKLRNLAVLNEGIGGNRVLHDVTGPSAWRGLTATSSHRQASSTSSSSRALMTSATRRTRSSLTTSSRRMT